MLSILLFTYLIFSIVFGSIIYYDDMSDVRGTNWTGYLENVDCTKENGQYADPNFHPGEICCRMMGNGEAMTKTFSVGTLTNIELHWDVLITAVRCRAYYKYDSDSLINMKYYGGYSTWYDQSYSLPDPYLSNAKHLTVEFRAGATNDWAACYFKDFYIMATSQPPTSTPTLHPTLTPTTIPTTFPTTMPTRTPTNPPTKSPTKPPTKPPTIPPTAAPKYSIQYIDSNVSCSNLHENVGIEYDKDRTECMDWCSNTDECAVFNYFEDFKQINDSRCYIFDELCDIRIDNDRKSVIGYFGFDVECINYPSNWRDNTGDNCNYYQTYNWCQNQTISRNENDFYDLIDYKYELTAIDSCCECNGGIHIMDNVAFSIDNWFDFEDILCTWEHSALTPQSSFRNWDNINLYDLCSTQLEDVNCNMLIDTQFNENDYDYAMHLCDYTSVARTNGNFSFVFDSVINDEAQTYDVFISTLWFNLDVEYYSSNVHIYHSNHSNCIGNIMRLNAMNQTTSYGIHPCDVLDLTNHPTNGPTSNPTRYPTNNPSNSPSHYPTKHPSSDPSNGPTYDPTNNPSHNPTSNPINSQWPSYTPTSDTNTTSIPQYSSTYEVSIQKGRDPLLDKNASTYVIISILSLVLVVCSVGVILLFRIYKKKDDEGVNVHKNNVLQEGHEDREDTNIYF
eukprot:337968_1